MAEIYRMIFIVGAILCGVMVIVSVMIFILMNIPRVISDLSGKTARKIGLKLKESARNTQVLCVTHSAQIASLADVHLRISKNNFDGRLESTVTELDREGRIEELSRILGGINVTQAQRQAALDMLDSDK